MKNKILFTSLLAVTLSVAIIPASAGALTYTSLTAWQAAGPQTGTIDFESVATGSYLSPLTISGIQFSSTAALGILSSYGPGAGRFVMTSASSLTITPSAGIFGLGFDLGCYSCGGTAPLSITVVGIDSVPYIFTGLPPTNEFWGVRLDSAAIQSVTITFGTSQYPAVDNLAYGGQASGGAGGDTPEAATLILIGTGLAVIAKCRRFGSSNQAI